jgi:Mrp family chromosome partitioning ATPase
MLTEYVKPTAFPNLSIITSGRSSAPHLEILDGPKIKALVDLVRSDFDMVLIDTPPVLDLADARIFSRQSDGVIVVCRASATDPDAARGATRRLQVDGSNVLGTILTDMPGSASTYNGSYYSKDRQGRSSADGLSTAKTTV